MSKGKGLEALIPKKTLRKTRGKSLHENAPTSERGVFFVEINAVVPNERQPRKDFAQKGLAELASSIRQHGILQPLVVEKHEEETRKGLRVQYHLLAGERRLRAAKMAGLKQVPVVIRKASDDRIRLLLSIIENVQREDLNAMERAEAYVRLKEDFSLSQEEIGERIGKSRESVANTLRLLQLSSDVQEALRRGLFSEGHARALLAAPEEKRAGLFTQLQEKPVSVREAEAYARRLAGLPAVPVRVADSGRARDEERLQKVLGVPVRITNRGERGSVAFVFRSRKEFGDLLKKLLK